MLQEAKQFLFAEISSTVSSSKALIGDVQRMSEEIWLGAFHQIKHPLLSAIASRTALGFMGLGAVGLEVGMLSVAQHLHFSLYHQLANGLMEAWKFGQIGAGMAATVTLAETGIRWMQIRRELSSKSAVQSPQELPGASDLQSIS